MGKATLRVDVKMNGLDAAAALIDAQAVIDSHRARIAELEANPTSAVAITPTAAHAVYMQEQQERIEQLEAELAATRRQPMETAPKDGTYVLVWAKWVDNPCVAYWADYGKGGRWRPCQEHVGAEGGWDGAVVVSRLDSDDVFWWAPLPAGPGTDSEQPKVSP